MARRCMQRAATHWLPVCSVNVRHLKISEGDRDRIGLAGKDLDGDGMGMGWGWDGMGWNGMGWGWDGVGLGWDTMAMGWGWDGLPLGGIGWRRAPARKAGRRVVQGDGLSRRGARWCMRECVSSQPPNDLQKSDCRHHMRGMRSGWDRDRIWSDWDRDLIGLIVTGLDWDQVANRIGNHPRSDCHHTQSQALWGDEARPGATKRDQWRPVAVRDDHGQSVATAECSTRCFHHCRHDAATRHSPRLVSQVEYQSATAASQRPNSSLEFCVLDHKALRVHVGRRVAAPTIHIAACVPVKPPATPIAPLEPCDTHDRLAGARWCRPTVHCL